MAEDAGVDALAYKRRCETCGEEFSPRKSNQRYCAPEHRPKSMSVTVTQAQKDAILALARQLA